MMKITNRFYILFKNYPEIDSNRLAQRISSLNILEKDFQIEQESKSKSIISFQTCRIIIELFNHKLPSRKSKNIFLCGFGDTKEYWQFNGRNVRDKSQSYLICTAEENLYLTTAKAECLINLYRVIYSFLELDIIGLIDDEIATFIPNLILQKQLTKSFFVTCSQSIPYQLWIGFSAIKLGREKILFCSQGHFRWNIKDLVYLGELEAQEFIANLFQTIFRYSIDYDLTLENGDILAMQSDYDNYFVKKDEIYYVSLESAKKDSYKLKSPSGRYRIYLSVEKPSSLSL